MAIRKRKDKFPLWLHPTGQWGKKIRGKYHYFGTDRAEALKEYVCVREDLEAVRKPRPKGDEARTVADVVNSFLTEKRGRVDADELSARTRSDYFAACEAVGESFGRTRPEGGGVSVKWRPREPPRTSGAVRVSGFQWRAEPAAAVPEVGPSGHAGSGHERCGPGGYPSQVPGQGS
jgi:hypothetical protein